MKTILSSVLSQKLTAKFAACAIIVSLLMSAFPASFFVAFAATDLFGPVSQNNIKEGTPFVSSVIDANQYENLVLSFTYNSSTLDGNASDNFVYGWTVGAGDNDLGTVAGLAGTDNPLEIGSVNIALPAGAAVSNLQVYVKVDADSDSDKVDISNLKVSGDLKPTAPPLPEAPKGTLNTPETAYQNSGLNVRICHAAGEVFSNASQSVDISAIIGGTGHGSHEGDIIPPFWYFGNSDVPKLHLGSNWNLDTEVIYNNNCSAPGLVDLCLNIEGNQETVPQRTIRDEEGNCVAPIACPYNSNISTFDEDCDPPFPPAEVCQNLLENGSFEAPTVTDASLWQKFGVVAGWTIERVSDNSPTTLEIHKGWSGNQAAQGAQYAELDGDWSTKITQNATVETGGTYKLTWKFAPRHGIAAEQNQLTVTVEGNAAGTNGPATGSAGLQVSDWQAGSYEFVAGDNTATITFADAGPSDSFGTFLDDAQLCLIKEPVKKATVTMCKVDEDQTPLANWELSLNKSKPETILPLTAVVESEDYVGFTSVETGCLTFTNVPYGSYSVGEVLQDGWENVSGLGPVTVDSATETFTIVNREVTEPTAEIVAEKIVCETEADLPNWNDVPGGAAKITSTTAADYVAASEGACWLEEDWQFEWALPAVQNPGDALVGTGGAGWNTFGPTDGSGKASVKLTAEQLSGKSVVWVREVLKDGYIPFTFGATSPRSNANNKTAEFYCHTDGLNYDNYDRVDGIAVDKTYHCVAFNTEKEVPPPQCSLEITSSDKTVRDTYELAVPTYVHQNWTDDITNATWIWSDYYVVDPEVDTTHVFTETFTVTTPSSALLDVGADNWYRVYINNALVLDRTDPDQENNFQDHTIKNDVDVLSYLNASGENTIKVEVTNKGVQGSNKLSNPAGALFKLNVTGSTDCLVTTEPKTPAALTIINPVADYDVVPRVEAFDFKATYSDDDETVDAIQWAIRAGSCESGTIAGNVDTFTDASTFVGTDFAATLDTSLWAAGDYCFVVNPSEQAEETDLRATRWFTINRLPPPPPPQMYRLDGFKFVLIDDESIPRAGWTIYADNGEETLSTTTDASGYYYFDVEAGDWEVSENLPEDWEQVSVEQNDLLILPPIEGTRRCEFTVGEVMYSEELSFAPQTVEGYTCTFTNQEIETEVPPTGDPDPEQSNRRGGGGTRVNRSTPDGQVLGAATQQCGMYLFDYTRKGLQNDPWEIQKLQWFLIGQGYFIPVTSVFDQATDEAVRSFQAAHQADVLTPWFVAGYVPHQNPTGWVYQLTRWKINNIVCPGSEPLPTLLP